VIKDRSTYEVMQPERVGVPGNSLVLGKLSGRAGLQARLEALGYQLNREEVSRVFESFKDLADKKREVTDRDLEALMAEEMRVTMEPVTYELEQVQFSGGDHDMATATVRIIGPDGAVYSDAATGNGPVDAVCNAIDRAIHIPAKLVDFNVQSVTEGLDSLGQVSVRVQREGRIYMGRSTSTDIVVASAKAYVSALNRLLAQEGGREVPEPLTTP
jgi:2-isopropylmalate synthase